MTAPLAKQAGAALGWRAAELIGGRLLSLAGLLVLARLVAPGAFGLLAIAAVVVETTLALTNVGVFEALVQRPCREKADQDAAWTLGMLRAVVVALAIGITAPGIAELFGEPGATPFLRALAVRPILDASWSIGLARLTRELRFRPIALLHLSAAAIEAATAIGLALLLPNIRGADPTVGAWAVVAAALTRSVASALLSYVVAPHRPRLTLRSSATRGLLRFGGWLLAASVAGMVGHLVLRGILSRTVGVAELGIFYLAVRITVLPNDVAGEVVRAVMFPLVSGVQHDRGRSRQAFQGGLAAMVVALVPVYAVLFALAGPAVRLALGEQWVLAVPVVQILAIDGIVDIYADSLKPLLLGVGLPGRRAMLKGLRTAVLIAAAWPLIAWLGVAGAAWAWLVAEIAQLGAAVVVARTTMDRPLHGLWPLLAWVTGLASVAAGLAWATERAVPGTPGLVLGGLLGLGLAWAGLLAVDARFPLGVRSRLSQVAPAVAARLSPRSSTP